MGKILKHDNNGWHRFRASNPCQDRSWGAWIKSCWRSNERARTRSGRASYWDSCSSSSEVYHRAIVIFANYEVFLIPEVAWHIRPFSDLPKETGLHEICTLVCGLVFSETELPYYAARILFELPSTAASLSQKPVLLPPPWFSHDVTTLAWLKIRDAAQFHRVMLILLLTLHSPAMNVFKLGEWWEIEQLKFSRI